MQVGHIQIILSDHVFFPLLALGAATRKQIPHRYRRGIVKILIYLSLTLLIEIIWSIQGQ